MSNTLAVTEPSKYESLNLAIVTMKDTLPKLKEQTDAGTIPVEFTLEYAAAIDIVEKIKANYAPGEGC